MIEAEGEIPPDGRISPSAHEGEVPPDGKRCSNAGCDRPEGSSKFFLIEAGKKTWEQDWSSLYGKLLCKDCYVRFRETGSLEKGKEKKIHRSTTPPTMRCTFTDCERPDDSFNFHEIGEGMEAGGQDWSSLTGNVLCDTCFLRFKYSGKIKLPDGSRKTPTREDMATVKKQSETGSSRTSLPPPSPAPSVPSDEGGGGKKCTYDLCVRPHGSREYIRITAETSAGGQDWRPIAGSLLCHACYERYRAKGSFDKLRDRSSFLERVDKRCSYHGCTSPDVSSKFYAIGEGKTAGGQDWSGMAGWILCASCYKRYQNRGTLERSFVLHGKSPKSPTNAAHRADTSLGGSHGPALAPAASPASAGAPAVSGEGSGGGRRSNPRRCSNARCEKPDGSKNYYRIGEGTTAGGQDWRRLEGCVFCDTCYFAFMDRGTLERPSGKPREGGARAQGNKVCSSMQCLKPEGASKYYEIQQGCVAFGRDWSSLVGRVLCRSCYNRYGSTGSCYNRHGSKEALDHGMQKVVTRVTLGRRCTNVHCEDPLDGEGDEYHGIGAGTTVGGRDWSSLVGSVLCDCCYQRYKERGTLGPASAQGGKLAMANQGGRGPAAAASSSPKPRETCSFAGCERPDEDTKYYRVYEGARGGGQDWSALVGSVLCRNCWKRYCKKGTLEYERMPPPQRPKMVQGGAGEGGEKAGEAGSEGDAAVGLEGLKRGLQGGDGAKQGRAKRRSVAVRGSLRAGRMCTYQKCLRPEHSTKYYSVTAQSCGGGRDWSALVGNTLCKACYKRFCSRGTLQIHDTQPLDSAKSPKMYMPGAVQGGAVPSRPPQTSKKCSFVDCQNPYNSFKYVPISEGTAGGGQDWTPLLGHVLCHPCYTCFRKRGSLQRTQRTHQRGGAAAAAGSGQDSDAEGDQMQGDGDVDAKAGTATKPGDKGIKNGGKRKVPVGGEGRLATVATTAAKRVCCNDTRDSLRDEDGDEDEDKDEDEDEDEDKDEDEDGDEDGDEDEDEDGDEELEEVEVEEVEEFVVDTGEGEKDSEEAVKGKDGKVKEEENDEEAAGGEDKVLDVVKAGKVLDVVKAGKVLDVVKAGKVLDVELEKAAARLGCLGALQAGEQDSDEAE